MFSFSRGEFLGLQLGSDCQRDRGNHTADHDRSHGGELTLRQHSQAECVSCFVDRTSHIKCLHGTQNGAEENQVGGAHVGEPVHQPIHNSRDWTAQNQVEQQADDQ